MSAPSAVSTRRALVGSAAAVALVLGLGAAMFPLRGHLSGATTALVLVVPVVIGVAIGGFVAGIAATVTGFLIYDLVFIRPYYTLSVGEAENWAALGVYVVVMVVVARVVARANVARAEAQLRAVEVRRLFDLSELLVRESSVPDLLDTIVTAVRQAFDLDGAALLLPVDGRLDLVASDGTPLSERELNQLSTSAQVPVSLETAPVRRGGVQAVALAGVRASHRAAGPPGSHRCQAGPRTAARLRQPPGPGLGAGPAARAGRAAPSCSRRSTACGAPSSARCRTTCEPLSPLSKYPRRHCWTPKRT